MDSGWLWGLLVLLGGGQIGVAIWLRRQLRAVIKAQADQGTQIGKLATGQTSQQTDMDKLADGHKQIIGQVQDLRAQTGALVAHVRKTDAAYFDIQKQLRDIQGTLQDDAREDRLVSRFEALLYRNGAPSTQINVGGDGQQGGVRLGDRAQTGPVAGGKLTNTQGGNP